MKNNSYSVSQAARYLDISPSTLRYWEREGLFKPARNQENSYREYSMNGLVAAADVAFLRRLGLSVDEVRRYNQADIDEIGDVLESAERTITRRIEDLETTRGRLIEQQAACQLVKALRGRPFERRAPDISFLASLDASQDDCWRLAMDDPSRYGMLSERSDGFRAADVLAVREDDTVLLDMVCALERDLGGNGLAVVWSRDEALAAGHEFYEGVLSVPVQAEAKVDVEDLFERTGRSGVRIVRVVGRYLLTTCAKNLDRIDHYLAWVECA